MKKNILIIVALSTFEITSIFGTVIFSENFDGSSYSDNQTISNGTSVNSAYGKTVYASGGSGSTVISTANELSGTRSLQESSDVSGSNTAQTSFDFGTGPGVLANTTSAIDVNFAFNLTSLSNGVGVLVRDSSGNNAGYVTLGGSTGNVRVVNNGSFSNLYTLSATTWYYLDLQLSSAASGGTTYTVSILDSTNSTILATTTGVFGNTATTGIYQYLTIYDMNSGGSSNVYNYFDNITVQTIPEPAVFACLILGICFVGRYRRPDMMA
ncbi:MAG: hypothetical protein V4507_12970 [Verrucomicrobiota bacterium]